MKVYERKSAGRTGEGIEPTTTIVSRREGLDEVDGCMLGTSHKKVLRMSSMGGGSYHIVYRSGEVVTLTLVDAPAEQAAAEAHVTSILGGKVHLASNQGPVPFPLCSSGSRSTATKYRAIAASVTCRECDGIQQRRAARLEREAK
ncbi:hypothetical protein MUK60_07410 [Streptomyces sp. LRE541]|uniref:hypothetical protein n=1 Tax=Streptomyces sp. LRE541 TaxID=2931983 RepID=UPI002010167B|nr:hypothetical protein [Streptomyces sp. LRE541]UPZ27660.1 hypothetical protein MUK60_07410 [Streptomyces sp. LRE541]